MTTTEVAASNISFLDRSRTVAKPGALKIKQKSNGTIKPEGLKV
jgi:hypothetical protein